MRVDLRMNGVKELLAVLRSVADKVPETARKTMHRGADKIVKEAQLNAPVDEHNLEKSIRKNATYDGFRGRLIIEIVAGGFVGSVNVDEYAMKVHENYDMEKPGPGTKAKRQANPGRIIGRKFLERAIKEQEQKLLASMVEAVRGEWKA